MLLEPALKRNNYAEHIIFITSVSCERGGERGRERQRQTKRDTESDGGGGEGGAKRDRHRQRGRDASIHKPQHPVSIKSLLTFLTQLLNQICTDSAEGKQHNTIHSVHNYTTRFSLVCTLCKLSLSEGCWTSLTWACSWTFYFCII